MGILNYSDDEVKNWMKDKTPDQIAAQAASMGLNADQVKQATDIGGRNYSAADISGFATDKGYTWGSNGALTKPAAAPQPAAPTAQSNPGGMNIGGTYYSPKQITDFIGSGGDPNRWAQEHGITNQDQIHQLSTQARQIAGGSTPTGDAAVMQAFKQYQAANPQGANRNNYAAWVAAQNPSSINAMRAGTFSGAAVDPTDYQPGGIYGPGSDAYGKPGYASGLGPRGDGGTWDGSATGAPSGGANTPPSGGFSGNTSGNTSGSPSGGIMGSSSSTSSAGGSAPGNWEVTAPQTVEDRIRGILGSGNPLVEQRRAQSDMAMNSRGLVNSSIAQTASDDAAYRAALEIAKPDAATFADAAKTNALAKTTWGIAQNNNQTSRDISQGNNQTSRDINQSNIAAQRELQHATQLYNNLQTQTASATSIQQWGLNNIAAIQASNLSAEAKSAAIGAVQQYLADSYQIQGDWHTSAANVIDLIFG